MIDGLRRRIEKLESKERQHSGLFVVPIYPGETEEEAMRLAGVPAGADTVVLIRRFSVSRDDVKGRGLSSSS